MQEILKSKRRGFITLLSEFKRLLTIEVAKHTARIDSAVLLEIDQQTRIKDGLERAYGEGIDSQFSQNPDLIGGIRIQISSDVYDGTVRARLVALGASFGIRSA
jgi:F-type H+-transporting ATPase subunit delta